MNKSFEERFSKNIPVYWNHETERYKQDLLENVSKFGNSFKTRISGTFIFQKHIF